MSRTALLVIITVAVTVAMPMTVVDVHAQSTITNPTADGDGGSISDAQLFEGDGDGQVVAWERSSFTLRANDTRAATQVPLPGDGSSGGLLQGQELGSGSFSETNNDGTNSREMVPSFELGNSGQFVQNPAGIFTQAERIELTFDDARADADRTLANQDDIQLIVAQVESLPNSFSEPVNILSSIDNANENASFRKVVDDETISSSGTFNQDLNLGPGQYIAFLVVTEDNNDGFEPSSRTGPAAPFTNLSQVDGNVAIVGVESVVVQEGSAVVDAPSGQPGDTLNFDVDTTASFSGGTNVDYTVAVYNQDRFLNSRIDAVIDTSGLGPNFNITQDLEVEHSIKNVIGVADVEDGITINGQDLSDGQLSGSVGLQLVIERFTRDLQGGDGGVPKRDAIDQGGASNSDTEDIKGSVTAIAGASQDETISVDTLSNFSTGTYQYIVYAQASDDSTSVSTDAGTVEISSSSSGGGGVGGGGTSVPLAEPTDPDIVEPILTRDNGALTAVVTTVFPPQVVDIDISQSAGTGVTELNTDRLQIEPQSGSSNVRTTVTTSSAPPTDVPELSRDTDGASPIGYLAVDLENLDAEETPGTFNFTVSESLLSQPDVEPEDIVTFRLDRGNYTQIKTEHLDDNDFSARTSSLSTFAIGVQRAPLVSVSSASLTQTAVTAGESVSLTVTAQNTGGADGTVTLNITADETVIDTSEVTVPAGGTVTSTIPLTIDTPGTYDIAVDGTTAGTLTVEPQATTPEPTPTDAPADTPADTPDETVDTTTEGAGSPGFDVAAAIVALLSIAFLALRRYS